MFTKSDVSLQGYSQAPAWAGKQVTKRRLRNYKHNFVRKLIDFGFVGKVIGGNLLVITGALLFCSAISLLFREEAEPFLLSALATLIPGTALYLITWKHVRGIQLIRREAFLTVSLSWILIVLAGSLPYLISGTIPSFTNALFESVSGFTTTGASILTDIEVLPRSILFWRSFTHWIGGIGIIVLVILIMPSLRTGGYHLFTLESSLQEKIHPKIRAVGIRLLLIYFTLTLVEIVLLRAGGMNLFESACHSFGTVATGGFSPRNSSIAGYSPYIQYVILLFMLLSGVNYMIHYSLLKRDFRRVRENEELRFYLLVVSAIGIFISAILFLEMHKPFEASIREGFFQVVSIITCTGFATADYMQWPAVAWAVVFLSMFLGGSTGSTAGGIKMARHLVALKTIRRQFRQMVNPDAVLEIRLNRRAIGEEANKTILSFIYTYMVIFIIGTCLVVFSGMDMVTAASSVATCMAGIGPGLGSVGPAGNFAHIPELAKIILTGAMLLGRLEIYTLLVMLTRDYWKT